MIVKKISIFILFCVVLAKPVFYYIFLPFSFKDVGFFPSFSLACSVKNNLLNFKLEC